MSCCQNVEIGEKASHRFVVSAEDFLTFQKLSGDSSLIHTDEEYARKRGFEGVVCYGGLMLAHLSHVLGEMIPGKHGLSLHWSIDYHRPLYVGDEAVLTLIVVNVSRATGMVEAKFTITRDGQKIASGKTQSIVPRTMEGSR